MPHSTGQLEDTRDDVRTTSRNLESLTSEVDRLEENLDAVPQDLDDSKRTIQLLTQTTTGYLQSRNRFMATFLRDRIGRETVSRADRAAVCEGDFYAHEETRCLMRKCTSQACVLILRASYYFTVLASPGIRIQ